MWYRSPSCWHTFRRSADDRGSIPSEESPYSGGYLSSSAFSTSALDLIGFKTLAVGVNLRE
jgi:hypothetical protein